MIWVKNNVKKKKKGGKNDICLFIARMTSMNLNEAAATFIQNQDVGGNFYLGPPGDSSVVQAFFSREDDP